MHKAYLEAYQKGVQVAQKAPTGYARAKVGRRGTALEVVVSRRGEVYHAASGRGWTDQGWSGGVADPAELKRALRSIGLDARAARRMDWQPSLPLE